MKKCKYCKYMVDDEVIYCTYCGKEFKNKKKNTLIVIILFSAIAVMASGILVGIILNSTSSLKIKTSTPAPTKKVITTSPAPVKKDIDDLKEYIISHGEYNSQTDNYEVKEVTIENNGARTEYSMSCGKTDNLLSFQKAIYNSDKNCTMAIMLFKEGSVKQHVVYTYGTLDQFDMVAGDLSTNTYSNTNRKIDFYNSEKNDPNLEMLGETGIYSLIEKLDKMLHKIDMDLSILGFANY